MNRQPIARVVLAGAVVGVVVATGTALPGSAGGADRRSTVELPLAEATLVCPESRSSDRTATDVAAVAAPGGMLPDLPAASGAEEPAALSLAPLPTAPAEDSSDHANGEEGKDADDGALARVDERGQTAAYAVDEKDVPPIVARAAGALAPGVTAGQLTRTRSGDLRGLAETPCIRPSSRSWFVGASSDVGRHGRLYLTNPEETDARVDVRMFAEDGELSTDGTRAIAVEARSQRVLRLDQLAPASKRLAVQVSATRGRVAAALRAHAIRDGTPAGIDWIPAAAEPATELVVPGVARGRGSRLLTVVAPGDTTASVEVSVMGSGGTFRPAEHGELEVEPGSVARLRLEEVIDDEAAAVRLRSDQPITASVRNEFGGDEARDVAYAAATAPLVGPAVIPLTTTGDGREARLQLSSVADAPGRATIHLLNKSGKEVGTTEVELDPGSTVETALEPPDKLDQYVAVVVPEKALPLVGTRFLVESTDDGPLASAWPLAEAPLTITQPVVRSDPAAALPVPR